MQTKLAALLLSVASYAWSQSAQRPATEPVPDLLKDSAERPAIHLEQFQQFALAADPTLQQANALIREFAGEARQAGLYPAIKASRFAADLMAAVNNPADIRSGGKLGLRRNGYEQQRRTDELGTSEQRYRVLSDVSQSFYSALAAQ